MVLLLAFAASHGDRQAPPPHTWPPVHVVIGAPLQPITVTPSDAHLFGQAAASPVSTP